MIVIEPGAVATELASHITHEETRKGTEDFVAATAIRPEDIADVIAFAVSRPRSVSLSEILVRPTAGDVAAAATSTPTTKERLMNYRTLGSSELQVSEISLGSWLTYAGGVGLEQTRACTDAAFDAGINFFDTANVYGQGAAESAWGEILSGRPRDSYILATKVFFPMSEDPADQGLSAGQIHKQIDASLARLRTDYVDLYQAHRFDPDVPIEETLEALGDVVAAGKARYLGFSEWTVEQIQAAVEIVGAEYS